MIIRALGVLAALIAATAPAVRAAEPVVMQYKFEPKEVLKYRLNMATEAKFQTPDGNERTTSMKNSMELSQELLEKKPDGTYRVAVTITKAEQTVDGKPAKLTIQVGTAMLLTMKPNGQVVESAAELPATGGQPQLQMLFPDKPVAEKDTWDQTGKIKEPIPMETVTKYVVESLAAEMPGYDGKVVAINSSMAMNQEKTPTGEEVASKTEGKIWFDAVRGRIVQSKARSTFHIAIPINLIGILPPNSRVKIDFNIDIDIALMK